MIDAAFQIPKKAEYCIDKYVGNLPVSRVKEEKISLAAQLDISIAQLNRIIRGDSDPSGTQLRIIADFFGVQVDDLYLPDEIEQ